MSDDNVFHFTPKSSPEDGVYNRIYGCLEAAFLNEKHDCPYCKQNDLIAKMIFEILINELIAISKKTNLQFSTFDGKMILNNISERILTLEQQTLVSKQEKTREPGETKFRAITGGNSTTSEDGLAAEKIDRKVTTESTSDREDQD